MNLCSVCGRWSDAAYEVLVRAVKKRAPLDARGYKTEHKPELVARVTMCRQCAVTVADELDTKARSAA